MPAYRITSEELRYMRIWLLDSFADCPALTRGETVRGVERHYPGGVAAFILEYC